MGLVYRRFSLPTGPADELGAYGCSPDLLDAHPRLVGTLQALGFDKITNPILRRTVARAVTLRQACALQGKDLDIVLSVLAEEIAIEGRAA